MTKALAPGTRVACPRCGRPCIVRRGPREDERPLTHSNTRKGWCANCAVTRWLKKTPPLCDLLASGGRWRVEGGPDALLLPHIQKQVANLMRVGNCPVDAAEIDWPWVVANWEKENP